MTVKTLELPTLFSIWIFNKWNIWQSPSLLLDSTCLILKENSAPETFVHIFSNLFFCLFCLVSDTGTGQMRKVWRFWYYQANKLVYMLVSLAGFSMEKERKKISSLRCHPGVMDNAHDQKKEKILTSGLFNNHDKVVQNFIYFV